MFPQIAKKKKRDFQVKNEVLKQWEEASKQLDIRSKLALKKISNHLLHDYSKVCRIKSIPQFYANYFLSHIYKQPPEKQIEYFSQQIESILTHRSHFHKINTILKEREGTIQKIKDSLLLVEGFMLMSQGKNVSLQTKGSIQELVKDCQSLEQLKELQKNKVEEFAKSILNCRDNNVNLVRQILSWRQDLQHLNTNEVNANKKLKIIYPHQAINCLLLPLYDTQFLKSSVLKNEINFTKDLYDPFFIKINKAKKGGHVQNYFFDIIKTDNTDYYNYISLIQSELPKDEVEQLREKEIEEMQKAKEKEKETKIKENLQKQREIKLKQGEKKARAESYNSLRNFRTKKQQNPSIQRSNSIKSSLGERTKRKVIDIDKLMKAKTNLNKQKQQMNKQQVKIFGVYQKVKKANKNESGIFNQKNEQIQQEKRLWQKQIKQEKIQKQKVQRLLKQTEKKALFETKQFQEKLKRYEQEVANLKSRIDQVKSPKRNINTNEKSRSPSLKKKSVASVYNSNIKESIKPSNIQLLQSKLQQESKVRRNLEQQIKQLGNEKIKLQKIVQKSNNKASKQNEAYIRKIQKYEEVISKLKNQSDHNKSIITNLQVSKITEEKKASESMRMYTIKEKEEELKKKIEQKIAIRENKKKLKQSKLQQKTRSKIEQQVLDKSLLKLQKSPLIRSRKDLQIVKTKQTIQIVFETKGKRKEKLQVSSKQLVQAESKLARLQKQRELLERKLQMSGIVKEDKNKALESKIQEKQQKVDYYKSQALKEKERSTLLEQNLKQVRKNIANQYELKLNKQRVKFEREKEELLMKIQKQKIEKHNKDKFLEQQMKLLKQMEKNQNELINMLEREKKQKKEKERVLEQELQEKQQLINLIQIEQIKKNIEREVRRQLLESDESEEEDQGLKDRKVEIQMQIQKLRMNRDQQINQIDQQNEKLKQLITRIKGQENKLLQVIKENIQINSQSEGQQHPEENKDQSLISSKVMKQETKPLDNQQLVKQLQNKSLLQLKAEQKMRQSYHQIAGSSVYKQKQKIENLVQFYLRSPHEYPGQKDITLKKEQKGEMLKSLEKNTKLIQQFQQELFSLKDLPSFVPSLQNDTINNHLLNLRDAYHQYQADSLRRELFPPLEEEVYNQKQLSFQSEEMPIITLNDQVQAHKHKYSPKKNDSKKNFLAINRMRLMILEQDKKKKQRQMVEQESKKKMARQHFEQNRKKREQKIKRKKEIQEMEKQKKRQQHQKIMKQKRKHKQSITEQPKTKRDPKNQLNSLTQNKKQNYSSNENSDQSRSKSKKNDKHKIIKNKNPSEKQISDSQSDRQKTIYSDLQKQKHQKEVRKKEQKETVEVIKQEQIQHSIDNKLAAQEEKAQKELLKQQVKSLQSEIREYINREQQFQVYQDFIKEEEVLNFIDKIMSLSTPEMINLNSNNTLKKDIEEYCTFTVLVAKNEKNIEIGIGLFHKQYEHGEYICDYILAHQMQNFLNLIFNFSKFIYQNDLTSQKIEFLFDLSSIEDQNTLLHFIQFEKKCKRLGEVYLKAKNSKQRKYVLKRSLFIESQDFKINKEYPVKINLKLLRYNKMMREVDKGFQNNGNVNHSSVNMLFSYYLSRQSEELSAFREKAENQLNYREVLVTALLLQKKQLQLKNITINKIAGKTLKKQNQKIQNIFDVNEAQQLIKSQLLLEQKMSMAVKRCVLQVGHQEIKYLIMKPSEAVTRIQSSNSSQTGLFLNLIPKYKVLIIQAEEFMTMSQLNPHLTTFFYVKHFIKNIVDVKKQNYERIYLPEVHQDTDYHLKDISNKVEGTTLFEQSFKMGWKQIIGNSIIFVPNHRDLVIQKPFIMAVLSGTVQRAVEGSPIFVKLIT